ncbi:MAG: hypothetical protein JW847_05985 [Candidatus Omnitrophica bacterium]|nr:hypothetical protein [Candidatus Omnitrophota bacterium]
MSTAVEQVHGPANAKGGNKKDSNKANAISLVYRNAGNLIIIFETIITSPEGKRHPGLSVSLRLNLVMAYD